MLGHFWESPERWSEVTVMMFIELYHYNLRHSMNMVYFACIYPQELPNFVDNYSNWDPTLTNMHHFVMMYYEYVYNISILQGFPDHETTVKTYSISFKHPAKRLR